jgi:hypothetical protein
MNEREMAFDKFAWLLSEVADAKGNLLDERDFQVACDFAFSCWQVLPSVGQKLLQDKGVDSYQPSLAKKLRDRMHAVTAFARVQTALCQRFTEALESGGIPYTLLKGSAARLIAYPHPFMRTGYDIDVAVSSIHIRAAEAISLELGFTQAQWNDESKRFRRANPSLRAAVESQHYELGFLVRHQVIHGLEKEVEQAIRCEMAYKNLWHSTKSDDLACYVTLDIHHGISLDINVDPLIRSSQRWVNESYVASIPDGKWLLLHLIFKIYWEGVHNYGKGSYQYADLVRLLPLTTENQLEALLELLQRYNIEVAAYFVLRRLENHFGLSLPQCLRQFIDKMAKPSREAMPMALNDLGDMWAKIWGYR